MERNTDAKPEIFDWLTSINTKNFDYTGCNDVTFVPFVTNRLLALHPECIGPAYEMSLRPDLDKTMQYQYLLHTIPKARRYGKLPKRDKTKYVELVMNHYTVSFKKALEILSILTESELVEIQEQYNTGGQEKTGS